MDILVNDKINKHKQLKMKNTTKDLILAIAIMIAIVSTIWLIILDYQNSQKQNTINQLCSMNNDLVNVTNGIIDLEHSCRNILSRTNPSLSDDKLTYISELNCEVFK
jgi:hypothetical protein